MPGSGRIRSPGSPYQKEADMSLPKLSAVTVVLSTLWFAAALSAQTADIQETSGTVSKVRIVRLSEVKGEVSMDRALGRGMESAVANLPIVEQTRVQTAMGAAEVEFEDNSSLRIGPNSVVEFPKLERLPNGATVSWVHVLQGTAYVSLMKSPLGNQFMLVFGDEKLPLPPGAHVRLDTDTNDAKLAVLNGSVQVQDPSGVVDVPKKRTVTFSYTSTEQPSVADKIATEPLDGWDKDSVGYHERAAVVSSLNSSPYSYGASDLMYYGSFMDAGSCGMGMMWRPYFTSAAWDPYSNGSWAWYGNSGYSWVSPYPWGWMPYHYGSWSFCPGMGWGWQPGGSWMGLNNMAMMPSQNAPGGGTGMRRFAPGHPPVKGQPTLVPVNERPLVRSGLRSVDSFEFRKDSAGLGIPRDTLGKLNKISEQTVTRGVATTQVYITGPETNGRITNTTLLGASVRRGSPPPSMNREPSSFPSSGARSSIGTTTSRATSTTTSMPPASSHPSAGSSGRPR
jgi:hypothetical protein